VIAVKQSSVRADKVISGNSCHPWPWEGTSEQASLAALLAALAFGEM
jgi:hypothetical protein